ncbi:MAG: hypothetical protein ABIG43_00185 [Chloroflexota bacterium]
MVEILSQCPTNFGRYALKTGDPEKVLEWIENKSILKIKAEKLNENQLQDKFVLGEFIDKEQSIFQGTSLFMEEDQ